MTFQEANLTFALNMHKVLQEPAKDGSAKNIFFSPYSIEGTLSMLYFGARRKSFEELKRCMAHGQEPKTVGKNIKKLCDTLNGDFLAANRLYIQKGYPMNASFTDAMQKYFISTPEYRDLKMEHEKARREINDWVAKITNGKIRDLLPKENSLMEKRIVIVNAVFFKGKWKNAFHTRLTKSIAFNVNPKKSVNVEMMIKRAHYGFYIERELGCKIAELLYEGGTFSMIVILPIKDHDLSSVESKINTNAVMKMLKNIEKKELVLSLPKFKIGKSLELTDTLKTMGMESIFGGEGCDFTGMSDNGLLHVSKVVQKSFVEVDEEGTEAAAATCCLVEDACESPSFLVNQPFLFFIRHIDSNAILFMGKVVNPSLTE